MAKVLKMQFTFQSTLPVGGTTFERCWIDFKVDISIHAPRGGSDIDTPSKVHVARISIHAPRGGERRCSISAISLSGKISIHAPRGGSDVDLKPDRMVQ